MPFFNLCEKTGLDWFFEQWVRSNKYLCYGVESTESRPDGDGYVSDIRVRRLGSMNMPVPVKAIFEDGSEQIRKTDRNLEIINMKFHSRSGLKEVVLNPENKLAMLQDPLPEISEEAADLFSTVAEANSKSALLLSTT